METVLVKTEFDSYVCSGCLASNRKLEPVGVYYLDMLKRLLFKEFDDNLAIKDIVLCWECTATMKRIKKFQKRVKHAHSILTELFYQDNIPSLTTLTCKSKDYFDYTFDYSDGAINETSINPVKDPQEDEKENIKEESQIAKAFEEVFNSFDLGTEECDIEPKLEVKKRKTLQARKKTGPSRKTLYFQRFKDMAVIETHEAINWNNIDDYYRNVSLEEHEVEGLLNERERKENSFENSAYKCKMCCLGYNKFYDLKRHKNLNHDKIKDGRYRCRVCKKLLKSKDILQIHWREHSVYMRCIKCSYLCSDTHEFNKHLRKHHLKTMRCVLCAATYNTLSDFNKHFTEAHLGYICDYCAKIFNTKRTIEKHIVRKHLPSQCKDCHKVFKTYLRLKAHVRLMHSVSGTELRYCVECDRQFPTVGRYRQHLNGSRRHNSALKTFRVACPECGKIFTRTNYMRNHYNKMHLKVTKHHCQPCDKYYANGYGLRLHERHFHQRLPPSKDKACALCGRAFSTNKALRLHTRTHTGERPHACRACPATFSQRSALTAHARAKHAGQNMPSRSPPHATCR